MNPRCRNSVFAHRKGIVAGLFLAVVLIGSEAHAQLAVSPWFIGGGSYGGGTADGNFMFGASQVIRAEGEYNVLTTQGLINFETARGQYIDNAVKWSNFYWRMREAHEVYRRQKLEQSRHSPDVLARVAASDVPRTLSSEELDPVTGKIYWPEALLAEQFRTGRLELEHDFELLAWTSRTPELSAKIREEVRQMGDLLRNQVESIPAADYVAARKFLDSLEYSISSRHRAPATPPSPGSTGG